MSDNDARMDLEEARALSRFLRNAWIDRDLYGPLHRLRDKADKLVEEAEATAERVQALTMGEL